MSKKIPIVTNKAYIDVNGLLNVMEKMVKIHERLIEILNEDKEIIKLNNKGIVSSE